ncbi:MAG TPA: immunoglobulin domain-containing protein, partial [Bacteroidales bacterium]|nr:immunoglobulin domain-containing protein [Bacteroidales bacterium]
MKTNQTTLLRLILPMVFLVFGMTSVKSQTSVTNPDTVCRNTIEIYRVDSTAGSSYAWSIKNGTGAILNTPVNGRSFIRIQWDNTVGSDSVFVVETNNFGCVGSANKLRVERYSEPVPTLSIPNATVCQNGSFTVTASPNGIPVGLSYQWYFGTNPIPGATLPTFSKLNLQPSDAGSYKCLVTNACGFNYTPDFTL